MRVCAVWVEMTVVMIFENMVYGYVFVKGREGDVRFT